MNLRFKQIAKNYRANKMLYWLILPIVIYVIIFNYIPMGGLVIAFQDYSINRGILGSKWIGFGNFRTFFSGIFFQRTMVNTLVLSLLDMLFAFPAPIILALMLNEVKHLRFKKIVQTVSYMPHFISLVVVVSLIKEFTTSSGIVSDIVSFFGGKPKSYIAMPQYFRAIFVVSNIWQSVGFGSIIYLAALSGVSEELYEASCIDGANRLQQLWHVTLPGIAPTIIIMLILRCGQIMSVNFEKVLLLYSSSNYETSDVIMTYVYRMGIVKQKIGYSTAVGLFNSVIALLLIVTANGISRKYTEISMF